MAYLLDSSKWKAYQFSDPFAAGSFFVCNKLNKCFCRPDCDARPITNLKSEIKFVNQAKEALSLGYTPCIHCDPMSYPSVNVQLLVDCVASINEKIGFLSPLIDENEEMNNQKIKENIIENKKHDDFMRSVNSFGAARRASVPVINYEGKLSKDFDNSAISKNDSDHYRLVDLACRHLALAAAMNVFQPLSPKCPSSPEESQSPNGSKKRRRRGGVLGFKELAAKSKLSAWHFHRVFKSVTGLTPKNYGDKCWEFIKNYKESTEKSKIQETEYETPLTSVPNDSSAPETPETTEPAKKKVCISHDVTKSGNDEVYNSLIQNENLSPTDSVENFSSMNENNGLIESNITYPDPNVDPLEVTQPLISTNFNFFNDQQQPSFVPNSFFNKAFSVPDLTKYNSKSRSLFEHIPRIDEQLKTPVSANSMDFTVRSIFPEATVDTLTNDGESSNNAGNMIDDFSNLIDSSVDEFNMNFQTQMERQEEYPTVTDFTEIGAWNSEIPPEFVPTNIGF